MQKADFHTLEKVHNMNPAKPDHLSEKSKFLPLNKIKLKKILYRSISNFNSHVYQKNKIF
jgi:hypothetical protein